MPSSRPVADSLVQKLQAFHGSLNADEQKALENLLQSAGNALSGYAIQPLSGAPLPEIDQLNQALTDARSAMGGGAVVASTWTTITITTITASHPRIGC